MKNIFVSYRRLDTPFATGWLCERLRSHFGRDHVFLDVDEIHPGVNFRKRIREALHTCDVVLVVIGHHWLGDDRSGGARLCDPEDWVRLEVSTAFAENVPVLPVQVQGAPLPTEEQLPEGMSELPDIQSASLQANEFDRHVEELVAAIEKLPQRGSVVTVSDDTLTDSVDFSGLILEFLGKYDRWYFNAARIHRWGGNKPGFAALADFSETKIRTTLKELASDGKVKSKKGKSSRLYKIA